MTRPTAKPAKTSPTTTPDNFMRGLLLGSPSSPSSPATAIQNERGHGAYGRKSRRTEQ
jgi:hypothetical protein